MRSRSWLFVVELSCESTQSDSRLYINCRAHSFLGSQGSNQECHLETTIMVSCFDFQRRLAFLLIVSAVSLHHLKGWDFVFLFPKMYPPYIGSLMRFCSQIQITTFLNSSSSFYIASPKLPEFWTSIMCCW